MQQPRKRRSDFGRKRVDTSYRTFTFRLNEERDADVIAIIDDYVAQKDDEGKPLPLQNLIIEALRGKPIQRASANIIEFFNEQLQRLDDTIERLNEMGINPKPKAKKEKSGAINAGYLSNLKKAMRGDDE